MWTGYWWEFTVEVVAGPTNVHLLSSKKQSQLLIMKGPQALTISSSFTLLITALYCAIIGVGVNANNQIYLKRILTAQTHGTAQLNRKKTTFWKLNLTPPFQNKTLPRSLQNMSTDESSRSQTTLINSKYSGNKKWNLFAKGVVCLVTECSSHSGLHSPGMNHFYFELFYYLFFWIIFLQSVDINEQFCMENL